MTLRVNETNKTLRVSSGGYDMSSNTELTLVFTLPDDTQVTKTSADGVVIGGGVTDSDLGVLAANVYIEYPIEASFLSQSGTWGLYLQYDDTATTPDSKFIGTFVAFTVNNLTGG